MTRRLDAQAPAERRTSTALPAAATSVAAARRFVRDVLVNRGVADNVVDVVALLTSEVVTNAILHGGSGCEVVIDLRRSWVRVEVADMSIEWPVVGQPAAEATSGRGLVIVDALASDWGVEPDHDGKRVWFEIARQLVC